MRKACILSSVTLLTSENLCFRVTLGALEYWLDVLLGSFHDLTCTVTRQQDVAHHLPVNFSVVESFSRLMVSTDTDSSISQLSKQKQSALASQGFSSSGFGKGNGAKGEGPCWGSWSLTPTPLPIELNTEGDLLAFLCGFFLRLYILGCSPVAAFFKIGGFWCLDLLCLEWGVVSFCCSFHLIMALEWVYYYL